MMSPRLNINVAWVEIHKINSQLATTCNGTCGVLLSGVILQVLLFKYLALEFRPA